MGYPVYSLEVHVIIFDYKSPIDGHHKWIDLVKMYHKFHFHVLLLRVYTVHVIPRNIITEIMKISIFAMEMKKRSKTS
jgi:hypothetical protein